MQETTLRKIPSWSDMVSSDEWKSADAATRNEVRVKWLTDLARLRRYGFVSGSDDELASFARDNGFDAGQVMFAFNQANADMIDAGVNEGGGLGKALQGRAADDMPFYLPEPGGFAYDMSKAVESGANQTVGGLMGLADMATGGGVDGLHDASQRMFKANRDMMSRVNTSVTRGFGEGGVAGAARALALSLGEQVAQQAIQMAISAATGGVGGLAAMGAIAAGNSWSEASEDDELSGWRVGAKVAVDTAAEVLSEVFELPILKKMGRAGLRTFVRELAGGKGKDAILGAVKQSFSAGGLEGFGEAWGQTVQYLGEQLLKGKEVDGKELAMQMADAGVTGFAMGAGLHSYGRAAQNASDLRGASRGSFERMLGVRELPEKYRTQRQRLQALDANVRMAEPITVGQPTDADRAIEKQRWLEWYDRLNEESRKEFADTREEIASQLEKLSATGVARTEAGERLWRLEQFLDDYETYSEGAREEYATQAERAREQADALRRAFPGLEAIEPVEQKPKAEEAKAETPATEEKTSEPPKVEPPKADEPPKAEPKEEKPVEPPKQEPLPVKDDDVRHRNIETREYAPEEGDESLPANVLEAKRSGRVAKVVNPDGSDAGEMFVAVVDAAQDSGDIRVSGDKGYTNEELQNRTEAGARDIQVREIGEDIRPEKLMLYGETNSGTPIVGGEDMHVESGNGRVKALRYAYGHGKAQQYLDAIRKEAERLGIPFPEKARMPVLVRVTMGKRTQEQRMDMVNKANAQTGQLGMSDTEQAYSDAKSIARHPGGVWSLFSGSRTSSMFSGANREFLVKVHELIGKRPDDIDEKMQWSESFEKRVTNAMLASLASNIEGFNAGLARQLIDEAPGTVNVKRGLAQTAPMVLRLSETMPDKNILPELGEALTHFVKYNAERNRNGIKVNEYLGQMTLGFDGEDRNDSPKMSKTAERIFRFMARAKSQRQVRDFIDAYVERAKRNSDSQSFLIEGMTSATKDEIVEDAIAVADRRDGDGGTNASMSDSSLASIEVPLVEGATMAKDVTGEKAVKGTADANHERVASFARDAETRFPSVAFRAVHDLSELDDDVRSRVEDDAMRQGIDVSRADAMMTHDSSGRPLCVLVSGNLKGELSRQKIEHEVIGHYGLRRAFGRKFDGLLDAIHRDLGERIERELGQSGYAGVYDMASDQSRRDATEEWLCQQAERGTKLWSRLAGRIRRWLRNMGFELKFTDADIADMLTRGRKAAMSSDGAQEVGAKFSVMPHEPDTPETTAAKGQAMARRILAPDAVTSIKDERILNLPALTELAMALTNGNLTAVDKIRMGGGLAEGVSRTDSQMASIQVLRELARYPQLGGVITVPEGLVSRQARLAMESFVEHGIPREQIKMTSTPDGEGNVQLMFTWEDKDMLRLRKVLAHEIGHVVDWTAGNTMRHNNILARVAGLVKKYLKHEIGETERTMDDLTTRKDVLRLAREARKNILPVRQAQGIKAKSPEGRKLFREELSRLIENESVKSGRFRRDVILDELRSLSKWWRGDFEDGDRYREKPAELYADFVSVLLTQPESVIRERAPEVWRMVQNWQSNRKEFTAEWERLQKEMDGDYAEQNDRLLRQLVEAFDQADEMLAQHNALPKPKATAREIASKAADYVASLVQDRWHTLYRLSKEDMARSGKEYRNTLASTIDSYLHSSSAEAYARDFIALWNRTRERNGLTQDEIGTFLLLKRIENDPTLAQRINTYGITPADASRLLGELRKRVGEEKWGDMERFHAEYWSMRQRALAKLTGSEAYSEELNDKMLDNEWYATRKTLSHVLPKEAMVGIGNGPSARIHAVRGSFEGTSNPMTETVLNDIRLMEGATLNRIRMQTVDILRQNVPDAAVRVDDLKKDIPNGFTRIRLWRKGKFESWDIDDVYAGGLRNILDGKMTSAAVKWLSAVNNVWRKGLTSYSPSFMLKNPLRDFDETFKNLPKSRGNVVEDLLSWLDAWAKGMKESFRYEFRGRSRSGIVERMMWDDYFIPGERVFYDSVEVRTQMDKLAKMAGEPTANTTTPEGVRGAIMKAMEVVGKLSSALERGTKVGGEMWLQENTSLPMEERRSIVQRRVGSPDFARGGQLTPITNNLLIFSNAIIQGYAASYDAIRGDWRTFVKRWMLTDGSMTILSSLAASGLLLRAWKAASGDDREETAMSRMLAWLKRAYGNVSLYNLYNYIILPLWETEGGETVFLRFPMGDQSKTMSKVMRSAIDAALSDRVMSQSFTDQLSKVFKDDFLFSPQPAVAGMADILTMMGGNNPRDEYHDRPAVNSAQWNAGGWEKAKGVATYLAGTYLPTSLIPSRIDERFPARLAGQATGLSAYIQVSNYGRKEQEDAMLTKATKWRAKVKLELKRHVDGGGKGFPDMGDELNGMIRKNPWLRDYAVRTYRSLVRDRAREERGVRRRSPVRKVVE